MSIEQIIVLAVVQGITEFLPISSSGHLILIPFLTGWPDQGQFTDVMSHLGTLLAVLIYFWRDVWRLILGTLMLFRGKVTDDGRLALYILAGTVPAILFGFTLKKLNVPDLERNITVVAWNTVIYGLLMLVADMYGRQVKTINDVTLKSAVLIGCAQALALIPGTSRSGVTMTAARFLNFTRSDAARFSFLLGIPATAAAIVLTLGDAVKGGCHITYRRIVGRGFHLHRRNFGDCLLDELASADQLPSLRSLPHGARRLPARARLRLRRPSAASAGGQLRPWPTGGRTIGAGAAIDQPQG